MNRYDWKYIVLFLLLSIPCYSRVQDARRTTALSEMRSIARAMELVQTDTGFQVTLRTLDNPKGAGSFMESGILQYRIESEPVPFAILNNGNFFYSTKFPYHLWRGPYITYQSMASTGNPNQPSEYGSPMDPWGNPYRFYTERILSNPAPGDDSNSPFGRNTLVSYGPNGLPGNQRQSQVGTGDDIVYRF